MDADVLFDLAVGRDLSVDALVELARLRRSGTEAEIRVVAAHLRCLPPVRSVELSDDQSAVLEELDRRMHDRAIRRREHRDRIVKTAGWFGREVGAGRCLAADADRRLEALIAATWDDLVDPLYIIAPSQGRKIARRAFADALRAGQRELAKKVAV